MVLVLLCSVDCGVCIRGELGQDQRTGYPAGYLRFI